MHRLSVQTRIRAALLLIPLVALLTALGVAYLRTQAHEDRVLDAQLGQLEADMNRLNGLEWQAVAEHRVGGASQKEVDSTLIRLRTPLAARSAAHETARLQRLAASYSDLVEREFKLLKRHHIRAARRLDKSRVNPTFEVLSAAGIRARAASSEHARSSDRIAGVATTGGILGTALVIALLLLAGERLRRRTTQSEARERAKAESEARVSALMHSSSDLTIVVRDGTIEYVGSAVERMLGRAPDDLIGRFLLELVPEAARAETVGFLARAVADPQCATIPHVGEWLLQHADGHSVPAEALVRNRLADPNVAGMVVNLRDLTDRKQLEQELRHQAMHDALTGLGNRSLFEDRVGHALQRTERAGGHVAVLFVDLDDFKNVNDSLGHAAGDDLLIGVAERISGALRECDSVARIGGDEFAVLVEEIAGVAGAEHIAGRVLASLEAPVAVAGRDLFVRASIGIASSDERSSLDAHAPLHERVLELLRSADVAMYVAKARGDHGFEVFTPSMHAAAAQRLDMKADLQRALNDREFVLHYQPIVRLESGRTVGAEALVRWEHAERGLVAPLDFIPLAEETGLIVPLGDWVLREACRQLAEWRADSPACAELYVSVNVASAQLQRAGFIDFVHDTLRAHDLPPSALLLEVTESSILEDSESNVLRLQALRNLGARIAIDDFGTGYSALNYLRRFKTDVLKIDRSFVDGVAEPTDEAALVKAIIDMSASLHLDVVAEGIESPAQVAQLRKLHCGYGQGFHYSRPMPAAQFEAAIAAPGASLAA